jgi:hypothetical protein
MLIKSLTTTTDAQNENCLVVTVGLKQVITVSTQVVTLTPGALNNNGVRQPIPSTSFRPSMGY